MVGGRQMQYHTHADAARLACRAALAHQGLVSAPSASLLLLVLYTATTETIRAKKKNTITRTHAHTHSHFRPQVLPWPRDSPRSLCSAATLIAAGPTCVHGARVTQDVVGLNKRRDFSFRHKPPRLLEGSSTTSTAHGDPHFLQEDWGGSAAGPLLRCRPAAALS